MVNLKVGGVSVIAGVDCRCPDPDTKCDPFGKVNEGIKDTIVCKKGRKIATKPTDAEECLAALPDTSDFRAVSTGQVNDLPNIARFMGKE